LSEALFSLLEGITEVGPGVDRQHNLTSDSRCSCEEVQMPQASAVTSPTAASRHAPPLPSSSLAWTWKQGCCGAGWLHVAGELDLTTSLELRYALAEAQLHAFLLVIDLRELTFMDCDGMQVILDAVGGARREGGQVVLVRPPAEVDRMFKVTGAGGKVMILDLDPSEPSQALLGDAA
jgi:anti-anti-sigma factor